MPTKFDFLSPGIELREIDQSTVAPVPENDGILLIGRAKKGPAMKPIKITSTQNFHDIFGTPMDGVKRNDPWREGNTGAGGWGAYAAEAYLAAGVGPVKYIRLAGEEENVGDAGWSTSQANFRGAALTTVPSVSGSLGIFVGEDTGAGAHNAVLAGILYVEGAQFGLYGTGRDSVAITSGNERSAYAIKQGSNGWTGTLSKGTGTENFTFNFTVGDQNFIRNVFNTDPTLYSTGAGPSTIKYFLGETFEHNVSRLDATNGLYAFVAPIEEATPKFTDHKLKLSPAKTGWFIGASDKPLFRLAALDEGSDFHKNYVARIKDLRLATTSNLDATFSIEIAKIGARPSEYEEKFSNLTLNSDSPNYISKKIGDVKQEWSSSKSKVITTGIYQNISDLVRIEVASGINRSDLPVGFTGPAKIDDMTILEADNTITLADAKYYCGMDILPNSSGQTKSLEGLLGSDDVTVTYPTHGLTVQNSYIRNGNYPATALFGLSYDAQQGREDYADIGFRKADYDPHLDAGAIATAAYKFTLESIVTAAGLYYYDSTHTTGVISTLIAAGVKQFVAPFFGGTDGVNILLDNPFNETELTSSGYAQYSMESALSMVADRDIIRYDLIAIPGVTTSAIIQDLVLQTENRGDALAIIDLDGIDQTAADTGTGAPAAGSISGVVTAADGGVFASSYAATYYPNIRLKDVSNGNGTILMAPPSIAGIGAIASSEGQSQPWFAPAGFNRGGLSPLGGAGGPGTVGTLEHLTKADRDTLYNVNINPIARFPATGDTVIFGQKTLQNSASALDRINVRRMMIYLKKKVGDIADTILFEQSVSSTFDKFKGRVEPILVGLKNEFGVSEFKIVLDETTTTPDLQDRNIMYAKVFVKPAKAIEFIAIDFVITQSGVEF